MLLSLGVGVRVSMSVGHQHSERVSIRVGMHGVIGLRIHPTRHHANNMTWKQNPYPQRRRQTDSMTSLDSTQRNDALRHSITRADTVARRAKRAALRTHRSLPTCEVLHFRKQPIHYVPPTVPAHRQIRTVQRSGAGALGCLLTRKKKKETRVT